MSTEADHTLALKAVHVSCNNDGDEYYEVGTAGVTAIEWGSTNGHMAPLLTVRVLRNGSLHSEHPFSNVLGVYYDATARAEDQT